MCGQAGQKAATCCTLLCCTLLSCLMLASPVMSVSGLTCLLPPSMTLTCRLMCLVFTRLAARHSPGEPCVSGIWMLHVQTHSTCGEQEIRSLHHNSGCVQCAMRRSPKQGMMSTVLSSPPTALLYCAQPKPPHQHSVGNAAGEACVSILCVRCALSALLRLSSTVARVPSPRNQSAELECRVRP